MIKKIFIINLHLFLLIPFTWGNGIYNYGHIGFKKLSLPLLSLHYVSVIVIRENKKS